MYCYYKEVSSTKHHFCSTRNIQFVCSSPHRSPWQVFRWSSHSMLQCSLYFSSQEGIGSIAQFIDLLTDKALTLATAAWELRGECTTSYSTSVNCFNLFSFTLQRSNRVESDSCSFDKEKRSAAEFALTFYTLATGSGWNKLALKAAYR